MLDDDTIKRLADEHFGITTGGGMTPGAQLKEFARACYAEGQRDAQERIAELERECDARDETIRILDEERDKLRARVEP